MSIVEHKLISSAEEAKEKYQAALAEHNNVGGREERRHAEHSVQVQNQLQNRVSAWFPFHSSSPIYSLEWVGEPDYVVGTLRTRAMTQMIRARVATNFCLTAH